MADYPYIDKRCLDLIKYPPLHPPQVDYGSDSRFDMNYLRGKLFQFCYRYIYDTNMKSVFSPYSLLPVPQNEELPNGEYVPLYNNNNYISVKIDLGHFTVDEVEVAMRIGNTGSLFVYDKIAKFETKKLSGILKNGSNEISEIGKSGGFSIDELREGMIINKANDADELDRLYILSIDKTGNKIYLSGDVSIGPLAESTYEIVDASIYNDHIYSVFRNNKQAYPISAEEAIEIMDNIPLQAGAMQSIEDNRLVVADVEVGYPNLDIDVKADVVHEKKPDLMDKEDFPLELSFGTTSVFVKFPTDLTVGSLFYINLFLREFADANNTHSIVSRYYVNNESITVSEIISSIIESISKHTKNTTPLINATTVYDYIHDVGLANFMHKPNHNYVAGEIALYNVRVYVAKQANKNKSPSGTTEDNANWYYLCNLTGDEHKNVLMIYSVPPVPGFSKVTACRLDDYGAEIYIPKPIYNHFKFGTTLNIGLEYADYAGRINAVQTDGVLDVEIPGVHEVPKEWSSMLQAAIAYNGYANKINLKINHQPPEWASVYRIMVNPEMYWFQQFYFRGFGHSSPDITEDSLYYKINVNRSIQTLRELVPKSNIEPYIFEKGDRIRILGYETGAFESYSVQSHTLQGIPLPPQIITVEKEWRRSTHLLDAEILGYEYPLESETYMKDDAGEYLTDANGNKIREISTGRILIEKFNGEPSYFKPTKYLLYEIYRPSKIISNKIYAETLTFDIGNPGQSNRYHKGNIDQTEASPAEIELSTGNVYLKMRYSGEAEIYFPVESRSLSDFYESDSISVGRVNAVNDQAKQFRFENLYMWTEKYFDNSTIVQLNKIKFDSKGELKANEGRIHGLRENGYILYVLQERKVTSMYVGREVMYNADGSESLTVLKDKVFGTIRPFLSDYGCKDPSTICNSYNHVYFWDSYNSCWCRIAYNGIYPISNYGMSDYFRSLNVDFRKSSFKRINAIYDNKYNELLTTFRYYTPQDYNLTITGQIESGSNYVSLIGKSGGDSIKSLEKGMILADSDIPGTQIPEGICIIDIDYKLKRIYLDNVIVFDTGLLGGTIDVTMNILKKFEQVTWAFHEEANAWKSRYSFIPEFYMNLGDELFTFKNGHSYYHHQENQPINTFYGYKYPSEITFSLNVEPAMVKLFKGIEVVSNEAWEAIKKGDIKTLSYDKAQIPFMNSRLPKESFTLREGIFTAGFLRDMDTPGFNNENYALLSGRFLRGQSCIVKLTNASANKVVLLQVIMYFSKS